MSNAEANTTESAAEAGPESSSRNTKVNPAIPLGLSMMYFLTNIIVGLPGAITVFFAFPCGDIDPSAVRRQVYWKTNLTTLPEPVREWIDDYRIGQGGTSSGSSFVQSGSMLYIYGIYADAPPQLYIVEDVGVEPAPLGYSGVVRDLTVLGEQICFVHSSEDTFVNRLSQDESHIYCGNHQDGFKEIVIPRKRFAFGLTEIDGLLWFLQIRADYYIFDPMRGGSCNYNAVVLCEDCSFPACQADTMKVMSLNVTTLELMSHSQRYTTRGDVELSGADDDDDNDDHDADDEQEYDSLLDDDGIATVIESDMFCDGAMLTRLRAFGAFFLSAVPVLFNSGRVWVKYAIPSSSVTFFVGIGYAFFCVWGVFDPWAARTGFRLWFAIGTPIWLLVCTYQLTVNPRVSKGPLWWSLYLITTGLLVLLVLQEYWEVVNLRVMDGKEITMWLFDIVVVHLPLLIIAILTESFYIALLTFIAFILLTSIMIWRITDSTPDTFLYGAIAYCAIFVVTACVYRARASLHGLFFGWLSACARHTCAIEATDEDGGEDTENTTGLLLNEEAEES